MSHSTPFETRLSAARSVCARNRHVLLEQYRNYLLILANVGSDPALRAKLGDSDLVQETMIQAHKDFDQFRGMTERELLSWMRSIMSAKKALLARKFYGTAARDPRMEQRLHSDMDESSRQLAHAFVASDPSPSQQVASNEREVILADALAALPKHYREVVILHHVKGQTLPSVAVSMGRSVDSVKKLWARAMVQLRSSMKELCDG